MYSVILVEDEDIIRRGIKNSVPWEEFNCSVVGEARNGEEGGVLIAERNPDIVITDINMPVASGLALLKELEESGRKSRKRSLFQAMMNLKYARQAIELDVLAYLLKPLEREKVYEAVEKAIGLLEEEQRQRESETSDFAGTVEVVLAEYLKNPESDLKEKLAELFVRRKENPGFYRLGLLRQASWSSPR